MSRGRRRLVAGLAVVAVAILGLATLRADRADRLPPGEATVTRTVDGDTVDVLVAGGDERVRLLGIDAPESVDPRRPVECYGKEAAARTAALLPAGTRVRLERDVEARDRYGRLLAHVYRVADGVHVNLTLVVEGYADTLTIAPNGAHAAELAAAARSARSARAGLWGSCPAQGGR